MKITLNCVNRSAAFGAGRTLAGSFRFPFSCSFFTSSKFIFSIRLFIDQNRPPGSAFGETPFLSLEQIELAGD